MDGGSCTKSVSEGLQPKRSLPNSFDQDFPGTGGYDHLVIAYHSSVEVENERARQNLYDREVVNVRHGAYLLITSNFHIINTSVL